MSKQTVITISEDNVAEVSTTNRKWLKRLANLTELGFAEEIESAMIGRLSGSTRNCCAYPFIGNHGNIPLSNGMQRETG